MSTGVHGPTRARIEEKTLRTDRWRIYPFTTFIVFTAFVIYATIRAFMGSHYYTQPYLSPLYSPCLGDCVKGSSDFGQPFGWWPLSAALIVLIFPLGFRMSCYYYRKAYYRAFWMSPPACAVAEPHSAYSGERKLPLILNNLHRYALYLALILNVVLTLDAVLAFKTPGGTWGYLGLGTLILTANAVALWLYTLSCHSCRNITAGRITHFSKHPLRYKAWTFVSKINEHHMLYAWISLCTVVLADFYVYLLASGRISDLVFFSA